MPPDDLEEKIDSLVENMKQREEVKELKRINEMLVSGHRLAYLLRREKYDRIIEQAQEIIKQDDTNHLAFYYQGLAFREQHKYTPAIEAFSKAIKVKPWADFYLERGIALTLDRKWAPAIQDYQKAREREPSNIDVQARSHFLEGRTWQIQGNLKRAIHNFDQVLQHYPNHREAAHYRRLALQGEGKGNKKSWWIVGAGALLSIVIGSSLRSLRESYPETPEPDAQVQQDSTTPKTETVVVKDSNLPPAIQSLLDAEFKFPYEIQIREELDENTPYPYNYTLVAYVYDLGTASIHRFINDRRYIGHYTDRSDDNVKHPAFVIYPNNRVAVDNYDGTITSYSLPDLTFMRRERDFFPIGWTRQEAVEELRKGFPNVYTLLNDAPSRFQAHFDLALKITKGWGSQNRGRCSQYPVLAFNNSKQVIIGGYICDDGELEQHTRIPYDSVGVTNSTATNILDTALYENSLLIVERGSKKIKRIVLDF